MPLTAEHGLLALATSTSGNKKIGVAAATYAAQESCPKSCAFYDGGGCYAENGTLFSSITNPLNGAAALVRATPRDVALEEAAAIDALVVVPGRPLRLHTVGDCKTDETAEIVAAACARYVTRGGGVAWAYTHGWRIVDRASWGRVSVLASCETPEQVELARARGYATALVVEEFATDRLHDTKEGIDGGSAADRGSEGRDHGGQALDRQRDLGGGREGSGARGQVGERALEARPGEGGSRPARLAIAADDACRTARPASRGLAAPAPVPQTGASALKGERPGSEGAPVTSALILPCPQQTRGVPCSECRLCMNDTGLLERGYSIGFELHGTAFTIRQARAALRTPSDTRRRLTLRELIPAYLAAHPGATSGEIARELGYEHSSVAEMRTKLEREKAAA